MIYGAFPPSASLNANGAIVRNVQTVCNGFSLTYTSGKPRPTRVMLSVSGLPGASVEPSSILSPAHDSVTLPITILSPAGTTPVGRTAITVTLGKDSRADAIFYAPPTR